MKDAKSLQLNEEEDGEPGASGARDPLDNEERLDRLDTAVASLIEAARGPVEAPRETAIQKVFREAEEGRSPEELRQAEIWVTRQMGGRLQVQLGPKGPRGIGTREIIFDRYKVTPEMRASGRTTLPDGFTVTHTVPVPALARFYIDIIVDEESYQSDAEKLLAIVEDSRERGTHPTEFGFLFDAAGELRPLKRRKRGKPK